MNKIHSGYKTEKMCVCCSLIFTVARQNLAVVLMLDKIMLPDMAMYPWHSSVPQILSCDLIGAASFFPQKEGKDTGKKLRSLISGDCMFYWPINLDSNLPYWNRLSHEERKRVE